MFKTESSIDHEAIGNIIGKLFETDGENLDRLIRIYEQLDAETRNAYILIGEKMLSK